MAVELNRTQIRDALALTDPAISTYLDLQTGQVVYVNETDTGDAAEQLRNQISDSYGDRYRYICGGNPSADDAAVSTWLEGEGL